MAEKKKSERFFTFSWSKAGWTLLLGIVAYYLLFVIMEVYRLTNGGLIDTFLFWFTLIYTWVFFLVEGALMSILALFIKIDNPTPFVENLVIYGPVVINLIWDYFLVCLVYAIIRRFKKK